MKWIKITADNFSELHIGDKVTKENKDEIANVMAAEPVDENSNDVLQTYNIEDASAAPEQTITLKPAANGKSVEVTRDEMIENWWWLKHREEKEEGDWQRIPEK